MIYPPPAAFTVVAAGEKCAVYSLEAAFQYAAPIALDVPLAAIDRAGFSALARGVQQLAEVALYLIDATEQVCFMFVFYDLLIAQEKTTKEADEETQQQEGASAEPPDATPPREDA